MPPDEKKPTEERKQTDESLRVEREKSDQTVVEQLAHVDETADAVIVRARALADRCSRRPARRRIDSPRYRRGSS